MAMTVRENVLNLLNELPSGVELVAAVKGRQPQEIQEAIDAGVSIIGENYVQEAEALSRVITGCRQWHFIGHLQKNKVKKAAALFDMIETLDSLEIAHEIDKRCREINRIMPVLIEINSGRESQKSGVFPENAESLIRQISGLSHIRITGLMTMGPVVADPEQLRPYFAETRAVFENTRRLDLPNVQMKCLSMGMSDSYLIAVEEGATMVRIGTKIFS